MNPIRTLGIAFVLVVWGAAYAIMKGSPARGERDQVASPGGRVRDQVVDDTQGLVPADAPLPAHLGERRRVVHELAGQRRFASRRVALDELANRLVLLELRSLQERRDEAGNARLVLPSEMRTIYKRLRRDVEERQPQVRYVRPSELQDLYRHMSREIKDRYAQEMLTGGG